MKIAQIAPLFEAVPPKLYGGTERVVAHLTDTLVELGHDVTLFSSADARTKAQLIAVRDQAIRLDSAPLKSEMAAHLAMLHEVRRRSWQFDVLHFHTDLLHFPMFEAQAHKTVTTVHGRLDMKDLWEAYRRWSDFGLVSISNDQRQPMPHANWIATVHHGFAPQHYAFNEHPRGKYLAFLGRVSHEKGLPMAIRLAQRVGIPLRVAAKIDACDRVYYEVVVAPLMQHPLVEFIGEIGDADKSEFLGNALGLLFPIDWPEPFGLVMIEAMACGTPIVACRRGSVPEIVEHGVTGFIVDSDEQALAAIERLPTLDRRRVRATFERRFSARTMARNYMTVYERLLSSHACDEMPSHTDSDDISDLTVGDSAAEATYELHR